MDFSLSEEQKDIKKAAREFVQGEFDLEEALDLERNGQFPFRIWKKACKLGFIGVHFPEKYGGQDLGILENAMVIEEFCRQHPGTGMALGFLDFGSEIILRFGNDDQKKKYLPPITKGESASSFAYMEDNQINNTIASTTDQGYFLKGQKLFVLNGSLSGPMIVLCQMDKANPSEQAALIVEKDNNSYVLSQMEGRVGMKMIPMVSLIFNDLRIPNENLIGNKGQGGLQFINFLKEMRVEIAAMGVGIAQGAFDLALPYAKQRVQFGQKIASFEAIRNKLADMITRIEMARLLTYQSAWDFDKNGGNVIQNYMAKMVSARIAFEVANDALQIFGGYGYVLEYRIEHFYREAQMLNIFGELEQVQKNLIADRIIGEI